jgi:hypothetical protein
MTGPELLIATDAHLVRLAIAKREEKRSLRASKKAHELQSTQLTSCKFQKLCIL